MDVKDISRIWDSWKADGILGKGAFGTVYRIYKEEFGKTYYSALKHISIPSSNEEKEQLYNEGIVTEKTINGYYDQLMYSLQEEIKTCYKLKGNSYIVSYEDHKIVPKSDGIGYDIFIRMELLTPLSDLIKSGNLTLDMLVKLGIDISKALETLEKEKIIHRDIKPSNIFVSENGNFKLGDFGVARELNKTVSGVSVKGTYKYMPPEVLKGEQVNFTSDIYSLGLVMYRLLNNNRSPFAPNPPQPISYETEELANSRRLKGEILPPPANADSRLGGIILRACEYYPQKRWQSASHLRKALELYGEDKKNGRVFPTDDDVTVKFNAHQNQGMPNNQPNYYQPPANYQQGFNTAAAAPVQANNSNNQSKMLIILLSVLIALIVCVGTGVLIFAGKNDDNEQTNNYFQNTAGSSLYTEDSTDETSQITQKQETKTTAPMPEVTPDDSTCEQYIYLDSSGSSATLTLYNKYNGNWKEEAVFNARIGKNGVTNSKVEGDNSTPYGEYNLSFCFGYNAPNTGLRFEQVNSSSVWVYDNNSRYYNTLQKYGGNDWVDSKSEKLKKYFADGSHTTCIYIEYNGDGLTPGTAVKGKGSMITICGLNKTLKATGGCIDITASDMTTLLSMLDSSKNPKIIIH